jgi:hypothetical protein
MAPSFYYVDASRQQQGPLPAEAIKSRWQSGAIKNDSLCFADDGSLATWTALQDVPALFLPSAKRRPRDQRSSSEQTALRPPTAFYYVDASRQQQGPLPAEAIKSRWKSGAQHVFAATVHRAT